MSTPCRRKNTSVVSDLTEVPHGYSFFQAVRLLERAAVFRQKQGNTDIASKPVARFTPPGTEAIRFHGQQSLSFQSAEISSIRETREKTARQQWQMAVNFMGLTGSNGVLPYHYTELILQRLKMKDDTLQHFFDLFNHRSISLFYQAASKYRLPIEYERKKLNPLPGRVHDHHTQVLLSLLGLGTPHLTGRQYTRDESLIYYGGLFTQSIRSTSGLRQILQSHFKIPVQIKEFIGQWQSLIDDVRTRLPGRDNPAGQNNQLGRSVMLGKKGWFAQGKINIILGPLTEEQLHTFAPGTRALKALNEIVRLYAGMEYDYDFVIRVKRADIPEKIKLDKKQAPIMGWNTWLASKPAQYDKDETLDISVSANRIR